MKRLTLSILSALCAALLLPPAFANHDLLTLVMMQDDQRVQAAIAAGADVNARDDYGNSPLTTAAIYSNDATLFKILLAAGADIEARDARGLTPLLIAIDSVFFLVTTMISSASRFYSMLTPIPTLVTSDKRPGAEPQPCIGLPSLDELT